MADDHQLPNKKRPSASVIDSSKQKKSSSMSLHHSSHSANQPELVVPASAAESSNRNDSTIQLRLVSMNLSQCQPSAMAPSTYSQQDQINDLLQEMSVLDNTTTTTTTTNNKPHILALQECPYESWAEETLVHYGYAEVGSTRSHCGYVSLLVHRSILLENEETEKKDESASFFERVRLPSDCPAVMAKLNLSSSIGGMKLAVASVHLAPFRQNSGQREQQVKDLLKAANKKSSSAATTTASPPLLLLFAGDTNMRVSEDATIEKTYHLVDAWKQRGSNPATRYTWDTVNHIITDRKSGQQSGSFNQYYGPGDTREYNARYDRIYFTSSNNNAATISKSSSTGHMSIQTTDFELIANRPIAPSRKHFLSDHFGIAATFQITTTTT